MASLNEFSVSIPQGDENASGYVALNHGTKYSILLQNNRQVKCDAKVEIDGKHQGTWRLPAREEIKIERPAHDSGQFTFYKLDSPESQAIGLDGADPNLGLLKVTFVPEKIQQHVNTVREISMMGSPESYSLRGSVSKGTRGMSAGGTGLSGESSQRFGRAEEIQLDYSQETVIHLRLVARDIDEPRPLTNYSTPIPPPLNK